MVCRGPGRHKILYIYPQIISSGRKSASKRSGVSRPSFRQASFRVRSSSKASFAHFAAFSYPMVGLRAVTVISEASRFHFILSRFARMPRAQRAAYYRVTLEDFEKDLDENGYTEQFRQGKEQDPYDRKRPVADMYTSMSALYQKCIKQLTDLLPKENVKQESVDELAEFLGR